MDYFLERRKKEDTAIYIARLVSLLMSAGGEIFAQGTREVRTGKFEGAMEIVGPDQTARARLATQLARAPSPSLPPSIGPLVPDDDSGATFTG